jgi:hypothetical protein
MGPRFQGRKNKSTPRSTNDQCDFKIGAYLELIYVKRKNPKPNERAVAQIPVVKGGTKCKSSALARKPNGERRCVEHLGMEYPKKQKAD